MADEEMTFLRLAYFETTQGTVNVRAAPAELQKISGTMVTDCKGLYDAPVTHVSAGLGADDCRSGIEAPGLRQSMASS